MDGATEAEVVAVTTDRTWNGGKTKMLAAIVGLVVALDQATKLFVQQTFGLYDQVDIIGDYLRLTYIHNPGAAFGIHLGAYSRPIFLVLSLVALAALAGMYWVTPLRDRVRLAAISLICGGAIGNLIDRVRSEQGVVDFLDVGIGDLRWPIFNVADIAVTSGAIFLALSLWQEEQRPERGG
ncbi:MAG TPA: signal peptidase II [Longimicrobiales bacterium]|nr:signal peptidase II [Longimicrobiales bacterium]